MLVSLEITHKIWPPGTHTPERGYLIKVGCGPPDGHIRTTCGLLDESQMLVHTNHCPCTVFPHGFILFTCLNPLAFAFVTPNLNFEQRLKMVCSQQRPLKLRSLPA